MYTEMGATVALNWWRKYVYVFSAMDTGIAL